MGVAIDWLWSVLLVGGFGLFQRLQHVSPRVRPLRLTGGAAGSGGDTRALVDWLVGVAADRAVWVGWCGLGHGRHRLLWMAGKAASGRVGEGDGLVAVRCELAGLWWSSWTPEAGRAQV